MDVHTDPFGQAQSDQRRVHHECRRAGVEGLERLPVERLPHPLHVGAHRIHPDVPEHAPDEVRLDGAVGSRSAVVDGGEEHQAGELAPLDVRPDRDLPDGAHQVAHAGRDVPEVRDVIELLGRDLERGGVHLGRERVDHRHDVLVERLEVVEEGAGRPARLASHVGGGEAGEELAERHLLDEPPAGVHERSSCRLPSPVRYPSTRCPEGARTFHCRPSRSMVSTAPSRTIVEGRT